LISQNNVRSTCRVAGLSIANQAEKQGGQSWKQ